MGDPGHDHSVSSAVQTRLPVVLHTKLHPPVTRPLMCRDHLYALLQGCQDVKVTLLCAPAGWGKSSLLATWAAAEQKARSFAWFSIDEADNDPVRFWTYVIEALRTVQPSIGSASSALLRAPGTGLTDLVIPELINEVAALANPAVLTIDDYHLIKMSEIINSMVFLINHLPKTLHIAISTRAEPCLPLARLRANGELIEIDAESLRFSGEETEKFLNEFLDLGLSPADVRSLQERTEGWAAGLYLAALSLRNRADHHRFITQFAGDDRHIVDYLGAEVLAGQDDEFRTFLLRTSILERLCAPLCDVVTGGRNSCHTLREIERSNLFLVPLDTKREWYRYHHLFRDLLRRDLEAADPELVPELHRRAAQWLLAAGQISEAIHHTIATGDFDRSCELIATHWMKFFGGGEDGVIVSWLEKLPDDVLLSDARVCLAGALVSISTNHLDETEVWLERAERARVPGPFIDGCGSLNAATNYARMAHRLGIGALNEARTFAVRSVDLLDETSTLRQMVFLSLGISTYFLGRTEEGVTALEEGLRLSRIAGVKIGLVHALGLMAVVRADLGQWDEADESAAEALAIATADGRGEHWSYGLSHSARGRLHERRGQIEEADSDLSRGTQLLRRGLPIFLAHALPAHAGFKHTFGWREEGRLLIREARLLVATFPDPGILSHLVEKTARRLRVLPTGSTAPFVEELSASELSVLRLLATALSQRDIAGRLCVSMNTVKSHTKSIFRKFGVSTRVDAVSQGRARGLI